MIKNTIWAWIGGLFFVGFSGSGTAGIGGGGGSPPAVMDLSITQFNTLARGALKGDLLEKINADGTVAYYEPTQLGQTIMMARSLEGENTLILNGLGIDEEKRVELQLPTDPSINTVPRE